MTQDEADQLNERVAWLERKMVRVLWLLVSVTSAFVGFAVAYTIDKSFGWPSILWQSEFGSRPASSCSSKSSRAHRSTSSSSIRKNGAITSAFHAMVCNRLEVP
jgi:hypothetical protein